jgi:glycosyltransferase involved in cell wall biosynthesis
MKPLLSVIIPFLNEQDGIPHLVTSLNSFFSDEHPFRAEVVFVNDGSTDNSLQILRQQQHLTYQAKIVSLSQNYGSHAALRAGIMHCEGGYITFMYADLQDPLELINSMFSAVSEGSEIVWACRNSTENKLSERIFSKAYSHMMRKYAVANYPKKGFDVVMFTQKTRLLLNENMEKNSSIFLQILTFGFNQRTIFYDKRARTSGKSKWTFRKKVKLFVDSFVAFSFFPIRLVSVTGICLFLLGIVWSAFLISRKLLYHDLVSGWPALMSVLSIGFGVTNISLGIIAEYLWRTMDASRRRPTFIVDEVIDLSRQN